MWQPIETAPRDGTHILVFLDDGGLLQSMTTAKWFDLYKEWHLIESGAYSEDNEVYPTPTHWQPLPPPPEK